MTAKLESDFEITNQLTAAEQKEWEDVFNLADAGDRARRKEVEEVTMVKEMNQLMYVPAVWSDSEEHNKKDARAEETEAEEAEEGEEDKEKTSKEKNPNRWLQLTSWDSRIVQKPKRQLRLDP